MPHLKLRFNAITHPRRDPSSACAHTCPQPLPPAAAVPLSPLISSAQLSSGSSEVEVEENTLVSAHLSHTPAAGTPAAVPLIGRGNQKNGNHRAPVARAIQAIQPPLQPPFRSPLKGAPAPGGGCNVAAVHHHDGASTAGTDGGVERLGLQVICLSLRPVLVLVDDARPDC